jgi:RNA polymerase sigma-70 factor (sigma-E family)
VDFGRLTTTVVNERRLLAGEELPLTSADQPASKSFDECFAPLFDLGYRVAYRILGSREDASEVAQETLARAERRWARLADRPEGWVATVATNLAIGIWRRARREWATNPPAAARAADDHLAERLDLVRALRSLPRRQRVVVVLRYLADRPEAEVALLLGCSPGSVKTHATRGLAALRTSLGLPATEGV